MASSQVRSRVTALRATAIPTTWLVAVLFITVALIVGTVLWPAIWSRRAARRKAAAQVLDSLIRLLRPGRR